MYRVGRKQTTVIKEFVFFDKLRKYPKTFLSKKLIKLNTEKRRKHEKIISIMFGTDTCTFSGRLRKQRIK